MTLSNFFRFFWKQTGLSVLTWVGEGQSDNSKATLMSVKTASQLVKRAMRAAIAEATSAADGESKLSSTNRSLSEVGKVNREFGQELHQHVNVYTGSIDEVGGLGSTADSWRFAFSERRSVLIAANGVSTKQKRRA